MSVHRVCFCSPVSVKITFGPNISMEASFKGLIKHSDVLSVVGKYVICRDLFWSFNFKTLHCKKGQIHISSWLLIFSLERKRHIHEKYPFHKHMYYVLCFQIGNIYSKQKSSAYSCLKPHYKLNRGHIFILYCVGVYTYP